MAQTTTNYRVNKEVNALYRDYEEDEAVVVNAKGNAECVQRVRS
jgi:hypothetical protein